MRLEFILASVPGALQCLDQASSVGRLLQGHDIEGAVLEQDGGGQLLQEDQVSQNSPLIAPWEPGEKEDFRIHGFICLVCT